MNVENIIQRFVDGGELTLGERKFLLLSLTASKTEIARFRVSKAEKQLLVYKAEHAGISLSEYLRNLTIREMIVPLLNGNQDDSEN